MTRRDPRIEVGFTHTLPSDSAPHDAAERPRSVVGGLRAVWRSSPWLGVLGRGLLALLGLLVLAWIGRSATASPNTRVPADSSPPPAAASVSTPPSVAASVATPLPAPAPAPPAPPAASSRARATAEDPVFVNYASAEDLRRLPGVGPKRAEAILALRQRVGRFQRVEDLLRVKGVGRATLRKWRPLLRLDTPEGGAP